jgi:WD40 repeat protein
VADLLEPSIVCILGRNEVPVGAGCIITDRHLVTCAHVVAAAISCDEYAAETPTASVPIQFAFSEGRDAATVETWWRVARTGEEPLNGRADLALLALSQPLPSAAKPARLAESDNLRHQNFVTFGFPAGQPLGVEAAGVCGGRRRDGRILVQTQTGFPIEPGFSGSPVWIEAYEAIGGILVERIVNRAGPPLAFVIPSSLLRAICPSTGALKTTLGRVLWVPDPPPGYIPRPELLAELRATLFAASATVAVSGAARSGALQGMGGIGKTVLASALVRDEEVRGAFPDGIYWLTLGQHSNVLARQGQLAHELSKQPESFLDSQAGRARLQELLSEKRSLVILDDVWSVADARAFDFRNTSTQLLLTTRDSRVVEAVDAAEIRVPLLSGVQARDLLANFSGQAVETLPEEATDIIAAAGGVPLALAMAGRLAQHRPEAWAEAIKQLRSAQLAAPRGREADFPYGSVAQAIRASVAALPPDAQGLFFDFAVFPEDAPIPLPVLERYWAERGLSPVAVAQQAEDFVARSLASWDEERQGEERSDQLILHDLVCGYLRDQVVDRALRQRRLIETHRPASGRWSDLAPEESYLWTWLAYHLLEAGWQERLKALLLEPAWIAAKLTATNVLGTIADYDRIPDDQDLLLVRQALTLSTHVLARDKTQLAGQLAGRLRGISRPAVQILLGAIGCCGSGLRLCPQTPSLIPSGSALLRTLQGHQDTVNAVAVLPNGRRALSGSKDGTLVLRDLDSGGVIRAFEGHQGAVNAVAVLLDGRRALSGAEDGTLILWDLNSGEVIRTLEGHHGAVNAVAVLPHGRALSGAEDATLKLWDLDSGEVIHTLEGHRRKITAVAMLPDGRRALSGSYDGMLKLWNLDSGEVIHTFEGQLGRVTAVAVLPDGRRALSGFFEGTVKLWDLDSGEVTRTLEGSQRGVTALAVLWGGRRALSASFDRTLKLWDVDSGKVIRTLEGHQDAVNGLAMLPDGRALSGSEDGTLKLWDLEGDEVVRNVAVHQGRVDAVAVLPDGRRALSGSEDGTLKLWDLDCGEVIRTLKGRRGWVEGVAVLPDGRRALSGSYDGTLKLWDLDDIKVIRTLEGPSVWVSAVAVLPDGRRALSGADDGTLKLWDLDSGEVIRNLEGQGAVNAVAVLPDGRHALSGAEDATLKLWNLDSGEVIRTLKGHQGAVNAVTVSPGGRLALSGAEDGALKVWDLDSGEVIRTLKGDQGAVNAVAALPDGCRALSGAEDGTVKLWDLTTGGSLAVFTADAEIQAVAVADDDLFIAGSVNGAVHILCLLR